MPADTPALTKQELAEKEAFERQHPEYGYSGRLSGIHAAEFSSRLGDSVYLDHAGSGLYTASHLESTQAYLSRAVLLNPHSDPATAAVVDAVRERVLKHLGVSARTHSVVFTYNVSTGLALLGAAFPFSASTQHSSSATACSACATAAAPSQGASGSELALLMDNHNSVLGLRERVKMLGKKGARFSLLRPREWDPAETERSATAKELECCCSASLLAQFDTAATSAAAAASSSPASAASPSAVHPCLLVFPAESNFDGRIYDASLAARLREYNHPLPLPPDATEAERQAHAAATAAAAAACQRNPLSLHHAGPSFRWYSALDASKYLCTSALNLQETPVDFVLMSFYKMFGYPTGLAALVVRKDAAKELWGADLALPQRVENGVSPSAASFCPTAAALDSSRPSSSSTGFPSLSSLRGHFSGGTVNAVVADEDYHVLRSSGRLHELLEDGTVAFTSIVALPYGFDLFDSLGVQRGAIAAHCRALTEHLFDWMSVQRYENDGGRSLCVFYGERARVAQQLRALRSSGNSAATSAAMASCPRFGGVLNFNFLDRRGGVIGYKTIEKLARLQGIYLRSGSFCNPGACQLSFPLPAAQIRANVSAGYACWEEGENLGGVTNGSVRVSVGWSTRYEDIARFKRFVDTQIRALGRHSFVSAGDDASATAETTATETSGTAPLVQAEVVPSPFEFKLPQHFQTAVAPAAVEPAAVSEATASDGAVVPASAASSAVASVSLPLPPSPFVLSDLCIYPIKSCSGVSLPRWWVQQTPLSDGGAQATASTPQRLSSTLFMDREFVLLDAHGVALSQKLLPKLQLLVPSIDLRSRTLTIRAPDMEPLVVPLVEEDSGAKGSKGSMASLCALQVCGQSSAGFIYDDPLAHAHISAWLTRAVGQDTVLARKSACIAWPDEEALKQWEEAGQVNGHAPAQQPTVKAGSTLLPSPSPQPAPSAASSSSSSSSVTVNAPLAPSSSTSQRKSFANEDDFLLVSAASVREVGARLRSYVASHATLRPVPADAAGIPATRFRPNLVVDSAQTDLVPFAEDQWRSVRVGPFALRVKGGCARCTMVNIDPTTATRQSALYALLHTCRRTEQGKVLFGSLLSQLTVNEQALQPPQPQSVRWWPIHVGMPCSAE